MNETGAVPQTHADDPGGAQASPQAPRAPRTRTRRSTIMLAVIAGPRFRVVHRHEDIGHRCLRIERSASASGQSKPLPSDLQMTASYQRR